jgi:hypothetical protein
MHEGRRDTSSFSVDIRSLRMSYGAVRAMLMDLKRFERVHQKERPRLDGFQKRSHWLMGCCEGCWREGSWQQGLPVEVALPFGISSRHNNRIEGA